MNRVFHRLFSALVLLGGAALGLAVALAEDSSNQSVSAGAAGVEVRFSPGGGCTEMCIQVIAEAKREVCMQAFVLTSEPIITALIAAHKRGVVTCILIDRNWSKHSKAAVLRLLNSGVPVMVETKHAIAHSKVIVTDGAVLAGSFNFTDAAEKRNAEDLIRFSDAALREKFRTNWESHKKHCKSIQLTEQQP